VVLTLSADVEIPMSTQLSVVVSCSSVVSSSERMVGGEVVEAEVT